MGTPLPLPKSGAEPPTFSAHVYCGPHGWMDEAGTLHRGRHQPRRLCVRWGPRSGAPLALLAEPSTHKNISAHVYCGQTAGWMKVVLGMEVGFSPGDFVFDGDPVPFPQKGGGDPLPFLLWPEGSMHQNATWYGCWPQPRGLCVRW